MACYLDKEKKNVYNFNSLDTMRYQGYYLEITNGINTISNIATKALNIIMQLSEPQG